MGQTGAVENIPLLIFLIGGALLFTMPLVGFLNVSIERIVYRPLRNAPRLAPLITAIGVSFILQNVALVLAGSGDRRAPQVFPLNWQINIGGASISVLSIFIFVLALVPDVRGSRRSSVGPGSDARCARPPRTARRPRSWASTQPDDRADVPARRRARGRGRRRLGPPVRFVRQDLGFNAGLKAFTAAVLGGIGNITGRRARRVHHRVHRELRLRQRLRRAGPSSPCSSSSRRPHLPAVRASSASSDRRPGMTAAATTRSTTPPRRRRQRLSTRQRAPLDRGHHRDADRGAADARPADLPAAVAHPAQTVVSTASRTPASTSCWRWASTSSSAWPACSTSATRRSSRSARTPMRTAHRRTRARTFPF